MQMLVFIPVEASEAKDPCQQQNGGHRQPGEAGTADPLAQRVSALPQELPHLPPSHLGGILPIPPAGFRTHLFRHTHYLSP